MFTATGRHRQFIIATCIALVFAAIGDAGPEIIASRSLLADYDGPGPVIYLAFAAIVAFVRWRYAPLLAVVMSVFFLLGGFADADFTKRLVSPAGTVQFLAAWLQILSFAATIVLGVTAVALAVIRPKPAVRAAS